MPDRLASGSPLWNDPVGCDVAPGWDHNSILNGAVCACATAQTTPIDIPSPADALH